MFIVFEGIDASGKTTVARLLANHLQASYYATPPKEFLLRREEVDLNASADDHYRFYLDGIRHASAEIWELLSEGKTVISDRYWVSTYVYHSVMAASVSKEDFKNIVSPDMTVLLTVSPEVQEYRFAQRGMSAGDKRMLNQQEAISREFKKLLVAEDHLVAIDTSFLTPSDVMAQVLAEIRNV
jgi:dTMP kinase